MGGEALHLFGGFDAEELQRGDELNFDEAAELQEKLFLGRVAFREDVVMVIEKIERLRDLERILCDEGILFCPAHTSLH
jgi:hypothetical protein